MATLRNLRALYADLVHGHQCPQLGCTWRPGFRAAINLRLVHALMDHHATDHPDLVETVQAALAADERSAGAMARRRIELGVAVLDPDTVGLAHAPSRARPLDSTSCGLPRRQFGWTRPLEGIPVASRCPACFPTREG